MQSKTSCFNKALFLNVLKRFWPLWLVYLGVWTVNLPINMFGWLRSGMSEVLIKRHVLSSGNEFGVVIALIWAVLVAMAVWSFVYNPRSMSGIAALPLSRKCVFLSVTAAGALPALAVHLLVCLAAAAMAAAGGLNMFLPCLQVFAMTGLQFIFFYGFANLCAQLTGNIIVLPAVYLVLNFTAWAVEAMSMVLTELLVYGVTNVSGLGLSVWLSPFLALMNCGLRSVTEYLPQYDEHVLRDVVFQGWGVLALYAVIGLLLMAAALALYRRRRMETVGDAVAINVLKPVFKYCMSFGCALVAGVALFYMLLDHMDMHPRTDAPGVLIFMAFGAFVGYFAALMLIEKSFRVFRGHWRGYGLSLLVIALFIGCLEFDLFGLERRAPDGEDVQSVTVSAGDVVVHTDPEGVGRAIEIHRDIIEAKSEYEGLHMSVPYSDRGVEYVCFTYVLNNGRTFQREYYLYYDMSRPDSLEDVRALQALQNTPEAIAYRKSLGFELEDDSIMGGYVRCWLNAEQLAELGVDTGDENYILIDYYGYDREYVEEYMSVDEKSEVLEQYYKQFGGEKGFPGGSYDFHFSAAEMYELYTQCILPDMAEGKIGLIWMLTDEEYEQNVYSASINIKMQYEPKVVDAAYPGARPTQESSSGMASFNFSTTPLSYSSRTLEWLIEHGVMLNTVAQRNAESGAGSGEYVDTLVG